MMYINFSTMHNKIKLALFIFCTSQTLFCHPSMAYGGAGPVRSLSVVQYQPFTQPPKKQQEESIGQVEKLLEDIKFSWCKESIKMQRLFKASTNADTFRAISENIMQIFEENKQRDVIVGKFLVVSGIVKCVNDYSGFSDLEHLMEQEGLGLKYPAIEQVFLDVPDRKQARESWREYMSNDGFLPGHGCLRLWRR